MELVDTDPPAPLVDAEVERRVHDLEHRLEAQRATLGQYLEATGQTPEQYLAGLRPAAPQSVKADLALRAVAEAEHLEPTDADIDEEIERLAASYNSNPPSFGATSSAQTRCPRYAQTGRRARPWNGSSNTSRWSTATVSPSTGLSWSLRSKRRPLKSSSHPKSSQPKSSQPKSSQQEQHLEREDRRRVIKPVAQYHIPGVFEQTNRGEKSYDLFSRMLEENIVFLGTPIDDYVANAVCAQMLYLEYKNSDKEISLYINSPGGDITALFAIYDTMKFVKNDISTFCYGQAASAAAVILAGGTQGKRYALPHARILIHQPYGGAAGQAADIEIQAKEILRMRDLLNEMVAADTGQSVDKVAHDTDRDFIMSATEAAGVRHYRRSDQHTRARRSPNGCGRRLRVRGERGGQVRGVQ